MSFRTTKTKRAILEALGDKPCFRYNIVERTRRSAPVVSGCLNRLWREGLVMRSRDRVSVTHLEGKPGVGKVWRKISGNLWMRRDSMLMTPSGVVTVELPHTKRYTLEEKVRRVNVHFIEYVEEKRKRKLSQKVVIEFFKSRRIGAVSSEVAEAFDAKSSVASNMLQKMIKKGLLERRGHYNPILARETPFRGKIQGYVYGLAGTDQAKRRVEEGTGLYSPYVKSVYVEIHKDSSQKRFTPFTKFAEKIGEYETLKAIRILTQIYPDLVKTMIGGLGFVYDRRLLSDKDVERQTKFWEKRVSRRKMLIGAIGAFHEAFAQRAVDLALKNMRIKVTFWRRIVKGKEHYDIRLSNGRQIDRVLQVDFYYRKQLLWTHYYPIECKFYKGGIRRDQLLEFIDKLRTSREFGEYVQLREGNQTLLVHVIKQDVFPIFISPYFKKDTYALAKKYHVELMPTWVLGKLAGETINKPLDVRRLFNQYMKEGGGSIEEFLKQVFTKTR